MASWLKYIIIGFIFIAGCVMVIYSGTRQSANVTSTQEVQVAMESSEIGTIRESATNALDREALVANLILEVVNTHKEQGKDIKIDYVFLDKNERETTTDSEIDSVQFTVHVLDDKGKSISNSTQRISLNKELN